MEWVRARSVEQKAQRVAEIIDATARLYEKNDYEDITFALIAEEAGFTRSNLYKYFNTKEEIFLELIKYDLTQWREGVLGAFKHHHYSIEGFSATWVNIQIKHKRMVELLTILFTTIEKNSSLQSLISFKKKSKEDFEAIAEVLMDILPSFTLESMFEFLFAQLAMAIGAYPMLNLTEAQKEAMDTVGMASDPGFYKAIYTNSIQYLIQGLSQK